jgi:hypothetical protein
MAGAIERIEHRLRLQRYVEMGQSLGTRSLKLVTDRETTTTSRGGFPCGLVLNVNSAWTAPPSRLVGGVLTR